VSVLQPPVALKAGDSPINVDIGHAAPFVADLGDGRLSLLVGQFGDGKLRVYELEKSGDGYRVGKMSWLQGGGKDCSVPSG